MIGVCQDSQLKECEEVKNGKIALKATLRLTECERSMEVLPIFLTVAICKVKCL